MLFEVVTIDLHYMTDREQPLLIASKIKVCVYIIYVGALCIIILYIMNTHTHACIFKKNIIYTNLYTWKYFLNI